jgi:predicted amidohydrolase
MTAPSSEVGVACVQLTPARGRAESNVEQSVALIGEAADQGHELIVLPELTNSGYAFESKAAAFDAAEALDGPTCRAWRETARARKVWIVGGIAERARRGLYDSAILIDPSGDVLTVYRKIHLWSTEHLWFEPGRAPSAVVNLPFGRVAVAICFDLWMPEQFRHYARAGADIVCVPSNWSSRPVVAGGNRPIVDHLAICAAHVNAMYIAGADRAGSDAAFRFLGASMIVNPRGEMVARAELPAPETAIVGASLDLMEARVRKTWSRFNGALDVDPALFAAPPAPAGGECSSEGEA